MPILRTDEPVCPEGKLSCGNGECVDKELFCNGKPDCKDESDENACSKCRFNSAPFGNRVGTAIRCWFPNLSRIAIFVTIISFCEEKYFLTFDFRVDWEPLIEETRAGHVRIKIINFFPLIFRDANRRKD